MYSLKTFIYMYIARRPDAGEGVVGEGLWGGGARHRSALLAFCPARRSCAPGFRVLEVFVPECFKVVP
jgi:hypothetical protein